MTRSAPLKGSWALSARSNGRPPHIPSTDAPTRPTWSNLPAGVLRSDRNGVRIDDLIDQRQRLLRDFLATAMSPYGYETIVGIVGADDVLSQSQPADRMGWSEDNYWLAFFGDPPQLLLGDTN